MPKTAVKPSCVCCNKRDITGTVFQTTNPYDTRPALDFASHYNFPNDTTNNNTTHPITSLSTNLRKNSEKRGREAGGPKTAVKPSSAYCKHRKICLESERESC